METILNYDSGLISEMVGNQSLNIQYHEELLSSPAASQTHPVYEIGYYLGGTAEYYVVGKKRYPLRPGDVLIIPPETDHYPVFPAAGESVFRCFELWIPGNQLDGVGLMGILQTCCKSGLCRVRSSQPLGRYHLEDYLEAMWWETRSSQLSRAEYLESLLLHFLIQLNRLIGREYRSANACGSSDYLLDMMIGHIQENFQEALSLQTLADRYFTSPSNVEMLFRRGLNRPFYRYMTECRIIHAQKLIREGSSMKVVCASCGYNDYSNFYRAFTKVTGITPTDYRRRISTVRVASVASL